MGLVNNSSLSLASPCSYCSTITLFVHLNMKTYGFQPFLGSAVPDEGSRSPKTLGGER